MNTITICGVLLIAVLLLIFIILFKQKEIELFSVYSNSKNTSSCPCGKKHT